MNTLYYYERRSVSHWIKTVTKIASFALFFGLSTTLWAQDINVTGKVVDLTNGEALLGATVLVKGTANGVITDYNGDFAIKTTKGTVLVVSFVGYASEEIIVNSSGPLKIELSVDMTQLSEVVIVGYGQVEKKDVTGSIATIDKKEFNGGVITGPQQLLAGKVAGVQITSNGGEPGGGSSIRIRGATSLSAGSDPLIVIDGIPVSNNGVAGGRNPLNFINPSDIESVTVLKDASASAIYGSRAANGVIIYTTKAGQSGKLTVNYDAFYSVSQFINETPELSPANFRAAINLKAPQELDNLGTASTNWVEEITRPATGLKQMISVSGGSELHKIYASANYLKNEGALNTSSNENTNFAMKYNGDFLNQDLKVMANVKYGITKNRFAPNVMVNALRYDPTRPVRDGNPDTGGFFQWDDPLAVRNPVAALELTDNTGETDRLLANTLLTYNVPFIDGLSLKTTLSYDVNNGENQNLTPIELTGITLGQEADSGRYANFNEKRTSTLFEFYGTYEKELTSINSKFDVTAGYSWQDFVFDREGIQVIKLGDNFSRSNPLNGTTLDEKDSTLLENRLISFFGRVNYSYDDKYLLTINLRRDGSTRFGPSNRWGLFPSMAVGWRILDESFAKPLEKVFTDLKFRFGFGIIGNQEINDYAYLPVYRFSENDAQYQFGDNFVSTIRPNGVDPDLKWEETQTANFGLDFGLLDGRLHGSVDYYVKKTNDLLFTIAIPAGTNTADRILTNIGEMENRGFELLLNGVILDKQDFKINSTFNLALNRNEIKKLDNSNLPDFPGYETGSIAGDVGQDIQILKVGESINTFRTYRHRYENGQPVVGTLLEMYEDVNGDDQITQLDRVVNKSPDPKVLMGLTTNISYKKFDLGFTFRSNLGGYVYNNVSSALGYFELLTDRETNNINESALDTNFNTRQLFSDYYVEDASFLKLDNISLGYSKDFEKFRFRVYTTAQNLMTITGYSGIDPEISSGIDRNIYPRSLTMLLGVSITY